MIENDKEFNKNLDEIKYLLSSNVNKYYDFNFIINDFKIFFEKYPNSPFLEENYLKLAGFYEVEMKDYITALRLNEEFIKRFPDSQVLDNVREDIHRLRKMLQGYVEEGKKHE